MPYSLSHAVVSLPASYLFKGRMPLASIVIGSQSPDFLYYIFLSTVKAPGHSFTGVLLYCLVPSLMAVAVWYRWLERPCLGLFHLKCEPRPFNKTTYFYMFLGVLIGAYTHVLWDATSHEDGALVIGSAFWNARFFGLPVFKWNQYGSGVLGLGILFLWYLSALRKNLDSPYCGDIRLGCYCFIPSIVLLCFLANVIHGSAALSEFAVRTAIGVVSGGVIGACLYALLLPPPSNSY